MILFVIIVGVFLLVGAGLAVVGALWIVGGVGSGDDVGGIGKAGVNEALGWVADHSGSMVGRRHHVDHGFGGGSRDDDGGGVVEDLGMGEGVSGKEVMVGDKGLGHGGVHAAMIFDEHRLEFSKAVMRSMVYQRDRKSVV